MAIMSDVWDIPQQEITSSDTSINSRSPAATFNSRYFDAIPGSVNADIGGGKYDNATLLLSKKGVRNVIIDPFNRSREHNCKAILEVRDGQADSATVNNVLNVIADRRNRRNVIAQSANAIKSSGKAFFLIYEGDKSGVGKKTKTDSWQENRKTNSFIPEILEFFSIADRHGNLIVAKNPISTKADCQ
jgi:hypothetical protein